MRPLLFAFMLALAPALAPAAPPPDPDPEYPTSAAETPAEAPTAPDAAPTVRLEPQAPADPGCAPPTVEPAPDLAGASAPPTVAVAPASLPSWTSRPDHQVPGRAIAPKGLRRLPFASRTSASIYRPPSDFGRFGMHRPAGELARNGLAKLVGADRELRRSHDPRRAPSA
jgi:hypothetical protein